MDDHDQILLILDVDETLLYASEKRLNRVPDCTVGPYFVYRRPFLEEFLLECSQHFSVAVWSSSSADYVEAVVQATFSSELNLAFV